MNLRIPTPWFLVIGLCAVFSPATRTLAAEFKGEAKVLAQLDDDWSASSVHRDLELLVSFYAADAIAFPPGDSVAHGLTAIHKAWEGIKDPNYSLSWSAADAQIATGGDIGFTSGTFAESIKGADGKVTHATGKFLCVWKKQPKGGWKAIRDMWNYDAK